MGTKILTLICAKISQEVLLEIFPEVLSPLLHHFINKLNSLGEVHDDVTNTVRVNVGYILLSICKLHTKINAELMDNQSIMNFLFKNLEASNPNPVTISLWVFSKLLDGTNDHPIENILNMYSVLYEEDMGFIRIVLEIMKDSPPQTTFQ